MKRNYLGLALSALVMVAVLLSFPGCGHDQELVSIAINPPGATITGAGVVVNFQAIGTYVHPPVSKDITTSVVWMSAAPQVVSIVSNTGVATSGFACGTNITITATAYSNPQNKSGNVVVGTAAVNVNPTQTQPPTC
jgi:hypothetical protein